MIDVLAWGVLALVGGGMVTLLVLWRLRRGGASAGGAARIAALIEAGDLSAAAKLALEAGQLDVAFDLFLRAREPDNAAAVAVRRGDLRRAANLYEQVKNWEQAIYFYDKVGLHRHADTLRQTKLESDQAAALIGLATPPVTRAITEVPVDRRPAQAPEAATAPVPAPVPALAPPPPSPAVVARPPEAPPGPSRAAAGALLAEGDISGAAELFAELGLDDEATHLWVNVLGEPGRAAPLVAGRGNHERAAELYQLAGDLERAAMAWVDAARATDRPEGFLERIVELSPTVALAYLETELAPRPLSEATAEWHYQKARAVDRGGDARRAIALYLALRDEVGSYRDVDERVSALSQALQPRGVASRTRRSTRDPIELPSELAADVPSELVVARAPAPASIPPPIAEVDREQLQHLAAQVADAAVDKVRRRSRLSTLPVSEPAPARGPATEGAIAGLEQSPLDPGLLDDHAVQAARIGPTLDALQRFAAGRPCDLGNIEVFYRIGLTHQAQGNFDGAMAAFEAVNETSPGYRDAWKRIEELRGWKQALASSSRLAASDAVPGTDRYELRGELGRGRIAVVYRAFDHQLRRDVALKFLSEALSGQAPVRELFAAQARAAAALSHPNLVTVHDTGMLAGRAFVSMELVDGQPVEALMREPGGLTIVEALRIMKQVLDGLSCLHGRAIIHHDLKPANIMRTASGLVKVMDAGLAISRGEGRPPAVLGASPAYQAPEALGGSGDLDQRVDIFAAAVSLFEMLSNKLPYQGGDRQTPPVRLATLVPGVPAQLETAIMRGLAVDRDLRWRTAAELGGRIGAILGAVNAYVAARGKSAPARPA